MAIPPLVVALSCPTAQASTHAASPCLQALNQNLLRLLLQCAEGFTLRSLAGVVTATAELAAHKIQRPSEGTMQVFRVRVMIAAALRGHDAGAGLLPSTRNVLWGLLGRGLTGFDRWGYSLGRPWPILRLTVCIEVRIHADPS